MMQEQLQDIRSQIDAIDEKIVLLLIQRMELAKQTAPFKSSSYDPDREEEILNRLSSLCPPDWDKDFIKELYKVIMAHSKKLQAKTLKD